MIAAVGVLGLMLGLFVRTFTLRRTVARQTDELTKEVALGNRRAEELRLSEERFEAIFDSVNDAIFIHDLETGDILDVNRRMCEMYGYSPEEARRLDVGAISAGVAPYTLDEALQWIRRAAEGTPQLFEWLSKDKSGRLFWTEVNMRRACVGDRERLLVTVRDISDRKQAQDEVERTAAQWQTTFDAAHDLVMLLDKDFKITKVNRATTEFLGLPAEKIVGRCCFHLMHETEEPPLSCPLVALRTSLKHEEGELWSAERGAWMSVSVDPVVDEQGHLAQVVHIVRDITERKWAEEALQMSEERFRTIFEHAPVGIFQSTTGGRLLSANTTGASLFGYDSSADIVHAITDIPTQMFVYPEQREDIIRAALQSDTFVRREVEYRRRDGSSFLANLHLRVMRNSSGEVAFLEGFVEDITERRRAEEAFHAQFRQISTIFDELSVITYVVDPATGELVYLNRYGTTLFGTDWEKRECHEVIGCSHPQPCALADGDHLPADGAPYARHVFEYENAVTGRWYQCVEKRMSWVDGRPVHITVAVDITDLKGVMQMQENLLSSLSHEIRTPLTAMCGYTEFLLENRVGEGELREYLGIIKRESERLNELLDNCLDLQRLRATASLACLEPLALPPLMEEAAAFFSARSTRHRIRVSAPPNVPPVFIGEQHLYEVLSNLLSNAVKYSPGGGEIVLGVKGEDNGTVVLWVQDEGIGMPPEVLEKVFDRFYQVDSGDRRAFGGTGLGLALVKEIVAAYGGSVRVESTLGKGSTFFVELPAAIG
jgi:PAS domain S-box-containing protein